MFLRGDIVSIIGMHNTGKTTFAKYLASTLDKNFIYIDFIHTSYDELEDLYNKNKSINCVIVFDNYVMMTNNMRTINLL
jgi:uridine kinase